MGKSKDKIALVEPKRIDIGTDTVEAEALVFPLGFRHLTRFNAQISKTAVLLMRNVRVPKGASEQEIGMYVMAEALPIVMGDLLELLKECIRFSPNTIKMDDLPHWVVPKLIEEWLIESFGTAEKRDPWKRAIESTVVRFTGNEINLSEMASSFLSQEDGASTPSSDADSPESLTEG